MSKPHGNTGNKNARGHGRPLSKSPRSVMLPAVRVTPAQREEAERLAREAGLTLSQWMADRLLGRNPA